MGEVGENRDKFSPLLSNNPNVLSSGRDIWKNRPEIAIIGAGMSGILAAYQLVKLGCHVTLIEATAAPQPTGIRQSGRVYSVEIGNNSGFYGELGAMRFPMTAYLFWHYMELSGAGSLSEQFYRFPNPGAVFTLFSAFTSNNGIGDNSISGMHEPGWPRCSADLAASACSESYSLPVSSGGLKSFGTLNLEHINLLINYYPQGGPMIPGTQSRMTAQFVSNLLKSRGPGDTWQSGYLPALQDFWKKTIAELESVTYIKFLKSNYFRTFTTDEINAIGMMGVGTGGFQPLFDVSILDIMRIVIWAYTDDFEVPNLYLLPQNLLKQNIPRAVAASGGTFSPVWDSPCKSVWYNKLTNRYKVDWTTKIQETNTGDFDFVVLAMTHVAAKALLQNQVSPTSNIVRPDANHICPLFDPLYSSYGSTIKDRLVNQNMMSSVKIFHTVPGPYWATNSSNPKLDNIYPWVTATGAKRDVNPTDYSIRASFGSNGDDLTRSGTTYLLPTPTGKNLPYNTSEIGVAVHYYWGEAARTIAKDFSVENRMPSLKLTGYAAIENKSTTNSANCAGAIKSLIDTRISGITRKRMTNIIIESTDKKDNFAKYFNAGDSSIKSLRNFSAVSWDDVPYIWGGFKLDKPGIGSGLVLAYQTSAIGTIVATANYWDKRDGTIKIHPSMAGLFFAGCSFSNYGGWIEGAFQSALATCSGIAYRSLQDKSFVTTPNNGLNKLSPLAKNLVKMPIIETTS